MAHTHYKTLLRKALLGFISEPDPVLAMLQWVAQQMMLIEAEAKVGAEKRKHSRGAGCVGLVLPMDAKINQ